MSTEHIQWGLHDVDIFQRWNEKKQVRERVVEFSVQCSYRYYSDVLSMLQNEDTKFIIGNTLSRFRVTDDYVTELSFGYVSGFELTDPRLTARAEEILNRLFGLTLHNGQK